VRLKGAADREDAYLQVSALRELFGLDAGTDQHESGRTSAPPTERPRIDAGDGADVASLDERRRRSERG
jgi:hypothetical protein